MRRADSAELQTILADQPALERSGWLS